MAMIRGTVASSLDGSLIASAIITIDPGGYRAVTDSRGEYWVFLREHGTYTVEVSSSGWITERRSDIRVTVAGSETVDFALDRDALWIKWKAHIGSAYEFNSSFKTPAIDNDGTIYIQTAYTFTAVNPDGTIKWKKETDLNVLSSPSIVSSETIVYNDYFQMYSIDNNGTENWVCKLPEAFSTAAVSEDSTLFLSNRDSYDRQMHAYTIHGEEKWKYWTGYETYISPVIGIDGTVYIGGWGNEVYAVTPEGNTKWVFSCPYNKLDSPLAIGPDNTIYAMYRIGYLYAINQDRSMKWAFTPPNKETYAAPIVGPDNVVYIVHGSGTLYALNPDGSIKWTYTDNTSKTVPVLGIDGTLYMGTLEGQIRAIDRNGNLKNTIEIGGGFSYAPKLAPDGTLYVYSDNGFLYAVQTQSYGYPKEPCWPCIYGSNRNLNRQLLKDAVSTVEEEDGDETATPEGTSLGVNRPNPFNAATVIPYRLEKECHVTITIYNATGEMTVRLVDGMIPAGNHEVRWNASGLASGVYFCRIRAGRYDESMKMTLLK
jgi:outer membrane protein assembly factor BamB